MKDGELLAEAKTDFVDTNIRTHQLVKVTDFFPQQEEITRSLADQALPLPEAAPRISPDFSEGEEKGTYTVRSTDIDLGGHMNNVAYLRAIMGLFSCREIEDMAWSDIDIAYRKPCFEGEVLTARVRRSEEATELGLFKSTGEAAVLVRLT